MRCSLVLWVYRLLVENGKHAEWTKVPLPRGICEWFTDVRSQKIVFTFEKMAPLVTITKQSTRVFASPSIPVCEVGLVSIRVLVSKLAKIMS